MAAKAKAASKKLAFNSEVFLSECFDRTSIRDADSAGMSRVDKRTKLMALGIEKKGSSQTVVNTILDGKHTLAKELIVHCENKEPISRRINSKAYVDDFFKGIAEQARNLKAKVSWDWLSGCWKRRLRKKEKTPKLSYMHVQKAALATRRQGLFKLPYVKKAWGKIATFVTLCVLRNSTEKNLQKLTQLMRGYQELVNLSHAVWSFAILLGGLSFSSHAGKGRTGAGRLYLELTNDVSLRLPPFVNAKQALWGKIRAHWKAKGFENYTYKDTALRFPATRQEFPRSILLWLIEREKLHKSFSYLNMWRQAEKQRAILLAKQEAHLNKNNIKRSRDERDHNPSPLQNPKRPAGDGEPAAPPNAAAANPQEPAGGESLSGQGEATFHQQLQDATMSSVVALTEPCLLGGGAEAAAGHTGTAIAGSSTSSSSSSVLAPGQLSSSNPLGCGLPPAVFPAADQQAGEISTTVHESDDLHSNNDSSSAPAGFEAASPLGSMPVSSPLGSGSIATPSADADLAIVQEALAAAADVDIFPENLGTSVILGSSNENGSGDVDMDVVEQNPALPSGTSSAGAAGQNETMLPFPPIMHANSESLLPPVDVSETLLPPVTTVNADVNNANDAANGLVLAPMNANPVDNNNNNNNNTAPGNKKTKKKVSKVFADAVEGTDLGDILDELKEPLAAEAEKDLHKECGEFLFLLFQCGHAMASWFNEEHATLFNETAVVYAFLLFLADGAELAQTLCHSVDVDRIRETLGLDLELVLSLGSKREALQNDLRDKQVATGLAGAMLSYFGLSENKNIAFDNIGYTASSVLKTLTDAGKGLPGLIEQVYQNSVGNGDRSAQMDMNQLKIIISCNGSPTPQCPAWAKLMSNALGAMYELACQSFTMIEMASQGNVDLQRIEEAALFRAL
ncbi:unnamed protein product [Amoebophrya sp. A25]|nr:unnamed protein product [Amoebophrya sp. A25]|eukprot:GSA25T00021976001.1